MAKIVTWTKDAHNCRHAVDINGKRLGLTIEPYAKTGRFHLYHGGKKVAHNQTLTHCKAKAEGLASAVEEVEQRPDPTNQETSTGHSTSVQPEPLIDEGGVGAELVPEEIDLDSPEPALPPMMKKFSVIEYSTHFAVKHNASGEERSMGDGVGVTFGEPDQPVLTVGMPGFRETWENWLNDEADETRAAYFPNIK